MFNNQALIAVNLVDPPIETGITGNGSIIQRRIPVRGPKGFVRVSEE